MALTYNQYLEQFKNKNITDKAQLQNIYDAWMAKLEGQRSQTAFKNAYQTYNNSLQTTNETPKATTPTNTTIAGTNTWASTYTPPSTSWISTPEQASNAALEQEKINIAAADAEAKRQQEEAAKRQAEDTARQQELIKQQEAQAEAQRIAIEKTAKEQAGLVAQQEAENKARLERELERTKAEKALALEANNQAIALQQSKDRQSLVDAQKKQRVAEIQAWYNMNKLWLWFTAGAIKSAQMIANEWAEAIANIQIQAAYNESKIKIDASNIELQFTKEVNNVIDTHTDTAIRLKAESIKRISEVNNSLLLNERQKTENINKIKDAYIVNKRKTQDELYANLEKYRDERLAQVKELEQRLISNTNTAKTRVNTLMVNGQWDKLSTAEKENLSKSAGITIQEAENNKRQVIYSTWIKAMQWVLWNDFIPTVAETDELISEVNRLTLAGRPMDEAINIVARRIMSRRPEYKAIINYNNSKYTPKTTTTKSSSSSEDKASNWIQITDKDWNVWSYNELTQEVRPIQVSKTIPERIERAPVWPQIANINPKPMTAQEAKKYNEWLKSWIFEDVVIPEKTEMAPIQKKTSQNQSSIEQDINNIFN